MKKSYWMGTLATFIALAVIGFVAPGFAEETTPTATPDTTQKPAPMMKGMGIHGKKHAGECPKMEDGEMGCMKNLNLTKEEREKVDAERKAFHESTKDLRRDIYQKSLELQSEMAKKDTDRKKAFEFQKQISDLKGQMEQKRLEHRFNMKKINPDLGIGMGRFHEGEMMGKGKAAKCPRQK